MKVIKKDKLEKIIEIAEIFAKLETGSKNQIRKSNKVKFDLLPNYFSKKEIELKKDKNYKIVVKEKENIQKSRKFAEYIDIFYTDNIIFVKETDLMYEIRPNYDGSRAYKISKNKIIAIIED